MVIRGPNTPVSTARGELSAHYLLRFLQKRTENGIFLLGFTHDRIAADRQMFLDQ